MKILVITSYYPPSRLGWGYMQLCEEVTDRLAARGHKMAVLTSTYRDGSETARSYPVYRVLSIDPDWNENKSAAWQFFVERRARERQAIAQFEEITASLQPDVIFIWDGIGLPRVLLLAAEKYRPATTVYYFANYLPELPDEYIAYWKQKPARFVGKLVRGFLGRLALEQLKHEGKPAPLQYQHSICVSHYVRQRFVSQGLIPESAVVIHNGIDFSAFAMSHTGFSAIQSDRLSCLVAGRVVPDKGVHTVVEAFGLINRQAKTSGQATLTILGDGPADYMQQLRQRVTALGIDNLVNFMVPVLREQMPEVLSKHDILIVSSEYGEPIARSMQEGMAMGLLVIGTTNGGSGELLEHERNGLVFPAADAQLLATQIARACNTPELGAKLARQGQEDVRTNFDIQLTVKRIEDYLTEQCSR
jgi:glycosyltransferase involved in cell wall biosynthesis